MSLGLRQQEQSVEAAYEYEADEVHHKRAMFGDAFGSRGDYSRGIFYGGRRKVLASPLKPLHGSASSNMPAEENNALELPEMFMSKSQTKKHRNGTKGIQFKLAFTETKAESEGGSKPSKNAVKKQEDKKMKMKKMIFLDRYSSTRREDWVECTQAGCTFYINRMTGEATVERPFECADGNSPGKTLPPINVNGGSRNNSPQKGIVAIPLKTRLDLQQEQQQQQNQDAYSNGSSAGTSTVNANYANSNTNNSNDSVGSCVNSGATRPISADSGDFEVEGEGTGAYVYDGSELNSFLIILDQHCAEQKKQDAARAEREEARRKAKLLAKKKIF